MSHKPAALTAAFLVTLIVMVFVAAAPAGAAVLDYSIIARDIIPSGQYGSVPAPPQATEQAQMYDALTPLFNHVTAADLNSDFKPDPVGSAQCSGARSVRAIAASGRRDLP